MDTTFTELRTIAVPVTDQDRTKSLLERLGFESRLDTELQPGFRWIELGLPGSTTSIALVRSGDQLPTGIDTGIRLTTPDARRARAAIADMGLDVGELLDWEDVPLMFSFLDLDSNRFYVSEQAG
jgi:hypothetical protein